VPIDGVVENSMKRSTGKWKGEKNMAHSEQTELQVQDESWSEANGTKKKVTHGSFEPFPHERKVVHVVHWRHRGFATGTCGVTAVRVRVRVAPDDVALNGIDDVQSIIGLAAHGDYGSCAGQISHTTGAEVGCPSATATVWHVVEISADH
jgi:hypothetical protein